MATKPKLELTWIGKDTRPRLEPRVLLEDSDLSYHAAHRVGDDDLFDNRLIHGDNLLALKALEQEFSGQIKCVYIDPPYNTGNAFEHYDDSIEHSIWLGLMRERLELLSRLLRPDGVIVVQIDREESAYLKVLMDEVFGRAAYVTTTAVRMSGTTGFKIEHTDKTIVKNVEYLHVYSRQFTLYERSYEETTEFDPHYSLYVTGGAPSLRFTRLVDVPAVRDLLTSFRLGQTNEALAGLYARSEEFRAWVADHAEQICRSHTAPTAAKQEWTTGTLLAGEDGNSSSVEERDYAGTRYLLRRTSTGVDQLIPIALKMNDVERTGGPDQRRLTNILGDWWDGFHLDMGNVENEGGVEFKNGKKPERLVRRILRMFTRPGDWVLDSFAGSGTTAAVAHKMGRRWITVELGDHCLTHVIPRLRRVIDGEDTGGVTAATGWRGGGGFRYYHLAPSLLERDRWGNWVISRDYNAAMLAEALCKLEGFRFEPSDTAYWQMGHSTERDFIYVTTQTLGPEQLALLSDDVGPERSLLVLCFAFRGGVEQWPNLTVQKIPKQVLDRCEWGRDDYSLRVQCLPEQPRSAGQMDLFAEGEGASL
jgi:adenine-specific DNA-methyltransferase